MSDDLKAGVVSAARLAELEEPLKPDTWADRHVLFLYTCKKWMFSISLILIIVSMYIGYPAFGGEGLKNGGFTPPGKESTEVSQRMTRRLGGEPEYTLSFLVTSKDESTYQSPSFQQGYVSIVAALKKLPVVGVISYYNFSSIYPLDTTMVSGDGRRVLLHATVAGDLEKGMSGDLPINKNLQAALEKPIKDNNLPMDVYVGGAVPYGEQLSNFILLGVEVAEFGTLPIIFVLLYLALGSLMASFMAWYVAIGTIFATLSVLLGLAKYFSISGVAANIVSMFGLGLAIDYALIVVSRFVEERHNHPRVHVTRIVKTVLLTSGRTIFFSAVTVFLALAGGLLYHEYFLASQCLAVMIAAILACFMANTFMLSTLMWMDEGCTCCCGTSCCFGGCGCGYKGNAVFWCPSPDVARMITSRTNPSFSQILVVDTSAGKGSDNNEGIEAGSVSASKASAQEEGKELTEDKQLQHSGNNTTAIVPSGSFQTASGSKEAEHTMLAPLPSQRIFYDVGKFVIRYPIAVLLASTCFLVAWTAYFFMFNGYGVTDGDVLPSRSHNRQVYDAMHDGSFPTLGKSRLYVYLETASGVSIGNAAFLSALNDFQTELLSQPGVVNIKSLVNTGQSGMSLASYQAQYAYPYAYPAVQYTIPLIFPFKLTDMKQCTYLQVSLSYEQYGRDATKTVRNIRNLLTSGKFFTSSGSSLLSFSGVGGSPAVRLDLYEDFTDVIPAWMGILLGSTFLLLLLMTKSVVVPLKAIVVTVLSLGATLGIVIAIFPNGTPAVQKGLDFASSGYIDGSNVSEPLASLFSLSLSSPALLLLLTLSSYFNPLAHRSSSSSQLPTACPSTTSCSSSPKSARAS